MPHMGNIKGKMPCVSNSTSGTLIIDTQQHGLSKSSSLQTHKRLDIRKNNVPYCNWEFDQKVNL